MMSNRVDKPATIVVALLFSLSAALAAPDPGAVVTSFSELQLGSSDGEVPISTLGGAEDPCDGRDNDGDEVVDEGCDGTCDNAAMLPEGIVAETTLADGRADVVWSGGQYGVAWSEGNAGCGVLRFARLDPAGRILGTPVKIQQDDVTSCYPAITWTGNKFGVAYLKGRAVYLARFDLQGGRIGSDLQVSQSTEVAEEAPVVDWDGEKIWVVFRSTHSLSQGAQIRAASIRETETPPYLEILHPQISASTNTAQNYSPQVSCTRTLGCGVIWASDRDDGASRDIWYQNTNDNLWNIRLTTLPNSVFNPALAWDGTGFGVVWEVVDTPNAGPEIYFARFDVDGNKLVNDTQINTEADPSTGELPTIAWTGQEYVVAWADIRLSTLDREIYLARVDTTGVLIEPEIRVSHAAGLSTGPEVTWNGSGIAVVWDDSRSSNRDVYFRLLNCCDEDLDLDGYTNCTDTNDADPNSYPGGPDACDGRDNDGDAVIDETCDGVCSDFSGASSSWNLTDYPQTNNDPNDWGNTQGLVWTGTEFAMSWVEHGGYPPGPGRLVFARFAPTAPHLASVITLDMSPGDDAPVSVAWTGTEFGVLSAPFTGPQFYRLDSAGNLLSHTHLALSGDLIWSGSEYAVFGGSSTMLRVDRLGNQIGSPIDPGLGGIGGAVWALDHYAVTYESSGTWFAKVDRTGARIGSPVQLDDDIPTMPCWTSHKPVVAWNGNGYGVAWPVCVADPGDQYPHQHVKFVRLDAAGNPIDAPVLVAGSPGEDIVVRHHLSMAATGDEYVVAWEESWSNFSRLLARRITGSGVPGDSVDVSSSIFDHFARDPRLVWTGTLFGVAWDQYGYKPSYDTHPQSAYFRTLGCCENDNDGDYRGACADCDDLDPVRYPGAVELCDGIDNDCNNVVDGFATSCGVGECIGAGFCTSGVDSCAPGAPAPETCDSLDNDCNGIIDDGEDYDADGVSECQGDCNDADASAHPLAPDVCDGFDNDCDGAVDEGCDGVCDHPMEIPPEELRLTHGTETSDKPSLAWTGDGFGVVWRDDRDGNFEVYFARLDAAMNPIGSAVRVTDAPGSADNPEVVWNGSEYAVVWEDDRTGDWEIYFTLLDTTGGKIVADKPVTNAPLLSHVPRVAWTGSQYGVTWADFRSGTQQAYFARLDRYGNKLGAEQPVEQDPTASYPPAIAWNGTDYGIAWADSRHRNSEIYFARFDESGTPVGPELRVTDDPATSVWVRLAWAGTGYGVAWRDDRTGNFEVWFAPLDELGGKIGADVQVTNTPTFSQPTSLVWTGNEYGLAWQDALGHGNEVYRIGIGADGAVRPQSYVRLSTAAGESTTAALAWTGTEYGVVWADARGPDADVFTDRVACCDDIDGDGYDECHECDDTSAGVHPGAVEVCDGVRNDCAGAGWPTPLDADYDTLEDACDACVWDALDDLDADGVCGEIDNCPSIGNATQGDVDADGVGDACDNCAALPNPDQFDADRDGSGNACDPDSDGDAVPDAADPDIDNDGVPQDDGDGVSDPCGGPPAIGCDDNCPKERNPNQKDRDADGVGDACDLADRMVNAEIARKVATGPGETAHVLEWKREAGAAAYNVYAGDLPRLVSGDYGNCYRKGIVATYTTITETPPPDQGNIYLVTAVYPDGEGTLGDDSTGAERPNPNPCP